MFCLVISTGFKSSLIAHLSVQAKSQTPEDFKDLVEFNNWRWGMEGWLMDGQVRSYFETSTDPVVQEMYKKMEVSEIKIMERKLK